MRKLGRRGIEISVMGFGCGGYWGLDIFDEKTASRLVHMAVDAGVNFFDTGASYSGGNAEIRLGRILANINSDKLIIGTKAGTVIRNGKLLKDYSPASITRQVEASLKNLRLDRLPLLQLHGFPPNQVEPVLDTLSNLKTQGKIHLAGASCDGDALEKALSYECLDVVMLTYNLIEKKAEKQIAMAHQQGCGILIKSPLAHTLYRKYLWKVKKLSDLWYVLRIMKNYRSQILEGQRYKFINDIPGWTAHEIALLFSLHDRASCVVTGTTNLDHMQRNIDAFQKKLPDEIIQMIKMFDQ